MKFSTISNEFYISISSLDLEKIWKAIAKEIMPKLVAEDFYVVPYPDEAKEFNLFLAYDKYHPDKKAKILKQGRTYQYLNPFKRMLNFRRSSDVHLNNLFTICESTLFGVPDDLMFATAVEDGDTKVVKKLTITITNMTKQWGYVDKIGKEQVAFSRRHLSEQVKRIYVINEVIVASSLVVTVTLGNDTKTWNFDGPIPLAFKFVKLKLLKDGFIEKVDKFNTLPRWSDTEKIVWKRPSETIKDQVSDETQEIKDKTSTQL